MALTTEQIADALRISRAEFGRIFLQAQNEIVENPADWVLFEAVGTAGIDKEAYQQGLTYAEQHGFLDTFTRLVVAEGLENGKLFEALAGAAAESSADPDRKAALQAIANAALGFGRPEVFFRGFNVGMRWTVQVRVDGAFSGTGILIGPNLVLTAWHVVRALFDPAADGKFTPKDGAAARLSVEFDDLSDAFGGGPQRVPAHVQWYATHSECHPEELASRLPDDLTELDGFWDYAVLRLAKTPGLERRWAALDARAVVPAANGRIIVFQHPAGQPMRHGEGTIVAIRPASPAIPRSRFLHEANTLGGSSGGPCFDRTFMLFGLHQGEWVKVGGNGKRLNRGVPILRIKEDIQEKLRELPLPDPSESPVWKLSRTDLEAPVVGCDPFQTLMWSAAVTGRPRVLLIGGNERTGKTFRLAVLSAMLPDSGHLKVGLKAEVISKMSALALAAHICQKAGATVPTFLSAGDLNSTASVWLRDEVVEKVIRALDEVRSQRLVWISIADLNKSDIQGEEASPFLLFLYERTKDMEWLRIVLDGMRGDAPEAVRKFREWHRTAEITKDDIATYLRRAIAESQVPDEGVVISLAGAAFKSYSRALNEAPDSAMGKLSETLQDFLVGVLS